MMKIKRYGTPKVIITMRKKNGCTWDEIYSSYALEILKKDPDVYEIRYEDSGKLIFSRENEEN